MSIYMYIYIYIYICIYIFNYICICLLPLSRAMGGSAPTCLASGRDVWTEASFRKLGRTHRRTAYCPQYVQFKPVRV